ncbi:hypothetical protein GGE56_007510 [Rhizobium leguminosarum]|uniref:Uncharacterized protein n=1 Tax=Rhizobium leguminosarum TaxID=384 RepID=A0A2Z4YL95_RHILE|nr:hypothetical protein DLJ82_3802 [Rhizobium leguminosarum]MBB4332946.1 hypothetical protein [Rhizobium leguminosarum]MBB4343580.1 hypothetical protein [Rhizobium leguminosarum]MBB4358542.1 hypothetical protein [Rhizobium leguminosarum]MBB4470622.1 hypothetical protein [Rhizobium leguminosarum]
MRANTSASHAFGSTSLRRQVVITESMMAARSAPRWEPAKVQFRRPSAIPRLRGKGFAGRSQSFRNSLDHMEVSSSRARRRHRSSQFVNRLSAIQRPTLPTPDGVSLSLTFQRGLWSDRHGFTERNPTLAFSRASTDPGDMPQDGPIPEYHPQIPAYLRREYAPVRSRKRRESTNLDFASLTFDPAALPKPGCI